MSGRVGFVVLAYNYGRFLPECLRSLQTQDHADWEAWVMDDASTDDTAAIAAGFTDPRFHYVRQPVNRGLTGNCNDGIARASGCDFIWIISADDALHDPGSIARGLAALAADPDAGMVWSVARRLAPSAERVEYFDWGSRMLRYPAPLFAATLGNSNHICAPGAFARRQLYQQVGPGPAVLKYTLDWYFWFRFALLAPGIYLPQPLACYRIHEHNMTHEQFGQPRPAQIREQIALHLWMQAFTTQAPVVAARAAEAIDAALAELFKLWADFAAGSETGTYLAEIATLADNITADVTGSAAALRRALRTAARRQLWVYVRERRPRAWWRGMRLHASLQKALA